MKVKLQLHFILLSFFALPLVMSACKPLETEESKWKEASEVGLPEILEGYLAGSDASMGRLGNKGFNFEIEMPEPVKIPSIEGEGGHFSEPLDISQARFAAHRRDKCPKLIATEVDSNKIVRTKEVLKKDHCDYFLFATKGDRISVEVQPGDLRSSLVSPVSHDFLNGDFYVEQTDKHVVRVDYKGSEFRNETLEYDIVVEIN